MSLLPLGFLAPPHPHLPFSNHRNANLKPQTSSLHLQRPKSLSNPRPFFAPSAAVHRASGVPDPNPESPLPPLLPPLETSKWKSTLVLPFVASAIFFIGFRPRAFASPVLPPTISLTSGDEATESSDVAAETPEDEELRAAFESWKKKTYSLTVPLRVVALHGSIPPSWIKDFIQAQGKRLKFNLEYRGTLESSFSELSSASSNAHLEPKSVMAADIVSVGDSWLSCAIKKGLLEPIQNVEEQDWFKGLSNRWKVFLCRNSKGELDSSGSIWGVPYRWGTMVIVYKKNKFEKHKLTPIEDWGDLWRPELAGKISMVDSPREVIGAVLKHMGASYNTNDIDSEVIGGREAAMKNLVTFQKQVRLFDSVNYLKSFGAGDVWVAVGWSSDVIPAAKRMSNVAVIVPKSGASLWADLWAIPAATKFTSDRVGARIRSPSPLIHQWIEFCLQSARGLSFEQQVIPGASPSALEHLPVEGSHEQTKGKPKLDTNLINGVPPPEILSRCEFLEPLSEKALEDYKWLTSNMQKPSRGWIGSLLHIISLMLHANRFHSQVEKENAG